MSDINFCNTKEQLNHLGEVVTGKVDGSPTGADIDTSTLDYTGQVRKTLPALEQEYLEAIQGAGGVPIGTWTSGITTFNAYNEYAVYNGIPYKPRTSANLPYVAQSSDPTAAPDDASVQPYQEIDETQVISIIEVEVPKLTDIVYKSLTDMVAGIPLVASDGDICWANGAKFEKNANSNGDLSDFDVKPLILGNQQSSQNSDRDLYQVSRSINGLTDCHAYSDKTVIENATDSGTYGTFDSTTEIAGTHAQSHQFSFQNRALFSGEGSIATWGGYISWPVLTGAASTVGELFHFEAKDLDSLGRFDAVTNQFGIKVWNQTKGISGNYAFWTNQDVGYSFYSNGNGKMLQAGEAVFSSSVIFGASVPVAGVPISWTGGVGKQKGFVSSSADSVQYGVSGDYKHVFISNAAERLILEDSSENYALRPASSTQDLGTTSRPFNEVKSKQLNMTPITAAEASNLSFFVDSADGKAKFKDGTGTVNALY